MKNMQKKYKQEISNIKLSDEQKQELICNLENLSRKENYSYNKFKKFSTIVAITGLLSISVYASDLLNLSSTSIKFLNPNSDNQLEFLSSGAYNVNKSDSKKSGEILVKEIIGDENTTYIFFDFVAPEGVILEQNKYYKFLDHYLKIEADGVSEFTHKYEQIKNQENIDSNIISFYYEITSKNNTLENATITFNFQDLQVFESPNIASDFYYDSVKTAGIDIYIQNQHRKIFEAQKNQEMLDKYQVESFDGDWKIKFDANFTRYNNKIFFEDMYAYVDYLGEDDLEVKINSVSVSPISINFELYVDPSKYYDGSEFGKHYPNDLTDKLKEFTIYYKDNSFEHIEDFISLLGNPTTNEVFIFSNFTNVLNDKEIDYIDYHGTKIYINN